MASDVGVDQGSVELPEPRPAVVVANPAGETYRIDLRKGAFTEFWQSGKPVAALLAWTLVKVLGVRLPASTDDPAVEFLEEYRSGDLPEDARGEVQPLVEELARIGFRGVSYHHIPDAQHKTENTFASASHHSQPAAGRVHLRVWRFSRVPQRKLFVEFVTQFEDGTFLWTTSGSFDTLAPESCRVVRRVGASARELWELHLRELAVEQRMRRAVAAREAGETWEMLHEVVREFHVSRGLFAPLSADEVERAESSANARERAAQSGSKHPGVHAAIQEILDAKAGSTSRATLLLLSLAGFAVVGLGQFSATRLMWIIIILLFHECGHFVAMRMCGYRNVRMFFIPGFGAAVSGRAFNVAGWKKVFVSLMGPVPGIIVGLGLGILGALTNNTVVLDVAFLMLLLNAFNLIPFLPLDGGHVAHAVLFSRHMLLDVIFRVGAGLAFLASGLMLNSIFGYVLAAIMLMGVPATYRFGRVARQLRREGLPPGRPDDQRVPIEAAERIIERLKEASPKPLPDLALASQTLEMYETLTSRRVGILASIGFTIVHVVSILVAVIALMIVVLAQHGRLSSILNGPPPAVPPAHVLPLEAQPRVAGAAPADAPMVTLLAELPAGADDVYARFAAEPRDGERVAALGNLLIISVPADDDARRAELAAALASSGAEVTVHGGGNYAAIRLQAIAPSAEAADAAADSLDPYFWLPLEHGFIAPWSQRALSDEQQLARRTLCRLAEDDFERSERAQELSRMASNAIARQDFEGYRKLSDELESLSAAERRVWHESLAGEPPGSLDLVVLERFRALCEQMEFYDATRATARELAARFGPAAGDPATIRAGYPYVDGDVLELGGLEFDDPVLGLAALKGWLEARGFTGLRYEVYDSTEDHWEDEEESGRAG